MIDLIWLDAAGIHVPLANPESILSCPELRQYARFCSDARRREFLLGRMLLKAAMIRIGWHQGKSFAAIRVSVSNSGKPVVAGVEFSLSHDGDAFLLALADQPIGVDLETVQAFDPAMLGICFSATEQQQILLASAPEQTATMLWCQKEATAKATGGGLASQIEQKKGQNVFVVAGLLSVAGAYRAYAISSLDPIAAVRIFRATFQSTALIEGFQICEWKAGCNHTRSTSNSCA